MATKPKPTTIVCDASEWRMGEYADFLEAAQSGRLRPMFVSCAKCVMSWPFAGDPRDAVSYEQLKPDEWKEVQEAVSDHLMRIFR